MLGLYTAKPLIQNNFIDGTFKITDIMVQLQKRLFHASGKVQALVLVILGALAATAFPPIHLTILLIPAFVALFWLVDAAVTFKGAFRVGWLFGVGHFAAGFYWVGHAFLVDAARYGWVAPFAVLGLAMGLALFVGLVAVGLVVVGLGFFSAVLRCRTNRSFCNC